MFHSGENAFKEIAFGCKHVKGSGKRIFKFSLHFRNNLPDKELLQNFYSHLWSIIIITAIFYNWN